MTRLDVMGHSEKIMDRRTIKKYFTKLIEKGLIIDNPEETFYRLKILNNEEACLIEYNTLCKFVNVFKQHSISIYIYLFNRYYAAGCSNYIITLKQVKDYIGVSQTTTSNNMIITDTFDILKSMGLLDYRYNFEDGKSRIEVLWVKNHL